MIELFLYFFLIFWWCMVIFYKWGIQEDLFQYSQTIKRESLRKFVEQLSKCEFCIENWVCLVIAIGASLIVWDFTPLAFTIPTTALSNILKSLRHY